MTRFIINQRMFDQIMTVEKIQMSNTQRSEKTNKILLQIEKITGVDLIDKPKLRQILNDLIFKSTDRGFSFYTTENMMRDFSAGTTTIRNSIQLLKQSGLFFIGHRKQTTRKKSLKNGLNASKGYVIFYKKHINFALLKSILDFNTVEQEQLSYHQEFIQMNTNEMEVSSNERTYERTNEHTNENHETLTGTSVTDDKMVSTFITSLLSSKQVINNYSARDLIQNTMKLSTDFSNLTGDAIVDGKLLKIMQYFSYKILDRFNRGLDIEYISNFCETFITNQFNLILHKKNLETKTTFHFENISKPVPFENWLNTDLSKVPSKQRIIEPSILTFIGNLKSESIDDYLTWEKVVLSVAERFDVSCSLSLEETLESIYNYSKDVYKSLEMKLLQHVRRTIFKTA